MKAGSGKNRDDRVICVQKKGNNDLDNTSFHSLPVYQDYKDRYSSFDETRIHPNKSVTLPVIKAESKKYSPIPYIFRIPNSSKKTINLNVRCPPFYIQLDHTIAVIWSLYANEEVAIPLGINQLQWAYSFLKNIKNKEDNFPPDIQHCLESISDGLINQYAEMSCDPQTSETYEHFNPPAYSTMNDDKNNVGTSSSKNSKGSENFEKFCYCKASAAVQFADEVDTCSGTSSNSEPCNKQPDYPFSVTYNDMKLHNNNLQEKSEKKGETVCNNSTKINDFLVDLRRDQLQKILADLDRLHCIEKYIGSADETFEPYYDSNDQALKDLIDKGFSRCTNATCSFFNKPKTQSEKGKTSGKDNANDDNANNTDDEAN